jgi:hypothetical protein
MVEHHGGNGRQGGTADVWDHLLHKPHVTRTHCPLDARGTGSALRDAGAGLWTADEIARLSGDQPYGQGADPAARAHRGDRSRRLLRLPAAFPEARLAPAPGTPESAAYLRWMFFAAGPGEAAITNASFGLDLPDNPQARGRSGYGSLELVADALAAMLSDGRDYVTGEAFSAADVYVGSQILWGKRLGTLPDRPGFAKYTGRLTARPAAVRAREIDDALMSAPS